MSDEDKPLTLGTFKALMSANEDKEAADNPAFDSRPVPGVTDGQQVDAGTGQECVPDRAFIEDAAEDALKVEAWRTWATLNGVIEPWLAHSKFC